MYGEIVEAAVLVDPATRRSRGFGFVKFTNSGAVETILHQHSHIVDGKQVRVIYQLIYIYIYIIFF